MKKRNHPDELLIGLVSISDRASTGVYEDQGVPALKEWFTQALSSPWQMETRLIPDDQATIEKTIIELVDVTGCDLVMTTGGTGPARRHARSNPGCGHQNHAGVWRTNAANQPAFCAYGDTIASGCSDPRDNGPRCIDHEPARPTQIHTRNAGRITR